MKKSNKNYFLYGGLFLISLLVVLSLYFTISSPKIDVSESVTENSINNAIFTSSKMTEYDTKLAKKLMDKDNDGRCDYCGMDVDFCIDSGMMECTMNPEAKIGLLNSDHIHTDFKIYLNGQKIYFNQQKYFVKSAFARLEQEESPEETGNVLHIHATGVPLWLFFGSLDMNFDSNCFKLDDNIEFCNSEKQKLKMFVNGIENNQFENYVPKNLDKILISYGNTDEINEQLDSITDFAKNKKINKAGG